MSLDHDQLPQRDEPPEISEDNSRAPRQEQGMPLLEPYKSEIRPHWRFRTPQVARASANAIYALYLEYRNRKDFVGMDMARRFLRMGYTRARRSPPDPVKAEAAVIFKDKYQLVRNDPEFQRMRDERTSPDVVDER